MTTQQKIIRRTSDVTLGIVLVSAVVVAIGAAAAMFGAGFPNLTENTNARGHSCADTR